MGLNDIRKLATGTFVGGMEISKLLKHPVFQRNLNEWGVNEDDQQMMTREISMAAGLPGIRTVSDMRKNLSTGKIDIGMEETKRLKKLFL